MALRSHYGSSFTRGSTKRAGHQAGHRIAASSAHRCLQAGLQGLECQVRIASRDPSQCTGTYGTSSSDDTGSGSDRALASGTGTPSEGTHDTSVLGVVLVISKSVQVSSGAVVDGTTLLSTTGSALLSTGCC